MLLYINGDRYHGMWINNRWNGLGKYQFREGASYEGQWSNDEKDGDGVYVDENGCKYEQQWVKGLRVRSVKVQSKGK